MPDIYKKHRGQSVKLDENSLLFVFRSALPSDTEVFAEHHHTAFEITMILEGRGVYATKNAEYEFSAGDIFFFSTDEIHWIKKLYAETKFINIHFEPRFIWSDNFGFSNKELIKMFYSRKQNRCNRFLNETPSAHAIGKLMFQIEKEISEKKPCFATMVKIKLISILVEMIRCYGIGAEEADFSYSAESLKYMEAALSYIDANLDAELTLSEIADVAHMSKTYFSSQFKMLNGISPWEYITIKRIEKAIFLIETTELSKLEIAIKCGFNNTSNFYYAFKKVTGKMPRDYKKISCDYLT